MTKVCHLTSAHDSNDVRIFRKECISLAKAGYDVTLIAPGESREEAGVHVIGVGEKPASRRRRMTETVKRVYQAALTVDAEIYHFHDPELMPTALRLKKRGKKILFDSHEDYPAIIAKKTWIMKPLRGIVSSIYAKYQSIVCRHWDAVISVTPHISRTFSTIVSKVETVCNFPIVNPDDLFLQPNYKSKTMVFAGGVTPQWGHDIILTILGKLPDAKYMFCGSADEAYLEQLRRIPGWNKAKNLGKIPHAQVAEVYAKGALGMALIIGHDMRGTLGNTKIFEYMLAGLPVVCTNTKIWMDIMRENNCGLCVDPTNADEVVVAIQKLLSNPELAQEMGSNGRNAVMHKYNWGVEEKKLLALYQLILAE